MDNTRAQQKELDDELVALADRLKIRESNLRLSSILKSKEPTLQVVLDALKLTPFYNTFAISTDVPEIYMQEFWVTVSRHHSSLRFKLNGKSHTVNIDNFRDMLKICPKLPGQIFEEPPLEEENLSFIRDLRHTDLVYQVENKNSKKNNDMYYPRFTKVIVDYFMEKDQAIPRRNKMFWHYARDDFMFTTIRVISKHQDMHARVRSLHDLPCLCYWKKNQDLTKSKGLTVLFEVALTKAKQIKIATKRSLIQTHSSHANGSGADEGTGSIPGVPDVLTYEFDDEQISWKLSEEDDDDEVNVSEDNDDDTDNDEQTDSDNDGDDFVHPKLSTHDDEARQDDEVNEEESDEESDDESNEDSDEEVQGANIKEGEMDKEATHKEDEANELYRDVNVNLEGRDTEMTDAPRTIVQTTKVIEDTHVIITSVNPEGQQQSSSVSSGFVSNMLNTSPDTGIDYLFNLNTESTSLVDVLVTTFAEPPLLTVTTLPPPPTPLITHLQQTPVPIPMHEAVKTAVQLQSERLKDEAQAKNADFLNKLDDNIKKIIKDQVKEQVKVQVSKILPKIEKTVNEQLEAEVLTRSSNESKTSHAVAAILSELEVKKILVDKMESNKSIYRFDEQRILYKALVDAYESEKLIIDTYGDTVSFKRRRDDDDKDEEPFARSNRGVQISSQKPAKPPAPDRDWNKTLPDAHGPVQPWLSSLAQMEDLRESFNELMDTPLEFSAFVMNRLKVDTLTPELLTGLTFELMKGSCKIERHNYKHLDWITVRIDDDKLYKFKEGDFNKLRIQDIEDMLLLLVQGKLTNLTVEERLAFNVSLSDLKRKEAYTAYSNPKGFIYQNKDKKNILMRIDELHKFSDGTLNDVRTALDDRLKGIRMKYLPQTIWRKSDRDKA
ncbi:hypothetical protein Tco_1032539 [Tanacetum coccineum]|uniref:Uncharacterized protein n=1 Tax=Tanacetum coccineum TaxID=301880 RepID=A0ABQ5GDU9_9ASTR